LDAVRLKKRVYWRGSLRTYEGAIFPVFDGPTEVGDGVAEAVAFGPVFGSARGIPLLDKGEHFGGS
jgi:hypothetical protein